MSVGKRTLGWMYAFMYVHETSNRVKSKFLPKVRIFIRRISISWRNNLINPCVKPYNVKNLHGRDFFQLLEYLFFPKKLHISFPCRVASHHDSPYSLIYTAFKI